MHEAAKARGVRLMLLQIPREVMEQQAVDRDDVRFFELAYLEAVVERPKKLTVQVTLKDFVFLAQNSFPTKYGTKLRSGPTISTTGPWTGTFRTTPSCRSGSPTAPVKIELSHSFPTPILTRSPASTETLVKVIDIFGNDTSQALDIEVK